MTLFSQKELLPKNDWQVFFAKKENKELISNIKNYISNNYTSIDSIFPKEKNVFKAFKNTPISSTKVVILGQDPYHGQGQAHGLSFSVQKDVRIPPSLKNIFKLLNQEFNIPTPNHGDLSSWTYQGVLLLNAILTVEKKQPASHKKIGWEVFTDNVIKYISTKKTHVVFLLWGKFAQSKIPLIDSSKHTILSAPHPSPFSAHKGFFTCQHFSKTNEALIANNQTPINWEIK